MILGDIMYLLNNLKDSQDVMDTVMETLTSMSITYRDFKEELCEQGERLDVGDGTIGIILTREMLLDCSCMYCLEAARNLFEKKHMDVVTGLYGLDKEELPKRVQWLFKTCLLVIQCEADQSMFGYFCAGRILKNIYQGRQEKVIK